MTRHLQNEIDKLKKKILQLSAMVEENVRRAVQLIGGDDTAGEEKLREMDRQVDLAEVEVEEECLKILALHQPVAIDLRYLVAILKINNDLERVSDQAVNIVRQKEHIDMKDKQQLDFDLDGMAEKAELMLRRSLDALVNLDGAQAQQVCKDDDEVDACHRQMYGKVLEAIQSNPEKTQSMIHLLQVSRNLERIADLATNIAEDVIYMIEGKIVRHSLSS